jgi:hypothetical protein
MYRETVLLCLSPTVPLFRPRTRNHSLADHSQTRASTGARSLYCEPGNPKDRPLFVKIPEVDIWQGSFQSVQRTLRYGAS